MKSDDPTPIEELLEQAPQLQRLAARLARGWDQDDLVQETWLRTLQSPPKNRRNLRSWLTGSLRHRAADHHRREASQRERVERFEEATASQPQHEQATPAELLARTEAHQAVVECLNDLEDPFRHALILHYFDGLSVTEIASKLGAPKPTISSRLKRGRERLREMMQARYGSSAYGMCAAAAGPFAPATLGVGTSSAAAAKTWIPAAGIVAAAVLVGGAAFLNWGPKPSSIEPARAQAALAENSAAMAGQAGSKTEQVRLASERDSKDNKHGVGSEEGDLVRIRGRCVDAISGMGIPDALVKVNFRRSNRNNEALHGNPDWQAPGDTRTDASGDFLVEFEESLSHQLSMSIEPIGYCPRTARWSLKYSGILAGTTTDLGEIRFELGHTISGTALDQDGNPVEGLQVSLANLPLPIAVDSSPNDTRGGLSDALGNFTISVPIPSGCYPVRVSDYSGYGSYEELFLTVGEQGLDGPWTLQVEKLETITGHVIDQNGAPIHRASISAEPEVRTSSKSLTSLTNQDGFFRIRRRYPAGPVRLSVNAGITDAWMAENLTQWETHDITIQLHRRPNIEVLAIDAHSNEAIEDFAIKILEEPSGFSISSSDLRYGGNHEGGILSIESVPAANFHVSVAPRSRGYVVSEWVHVESAETVDQPLKIELDPLHSYEVVLRTRDGDPVVGSKIEVLDLEGTELNEESNSRVTRLSPWNRKVRSFTGALRLDEVKTDAQGYAQVFGYEHTPMALRVTGDHTCLLIPRWEPRSQGVNSLELNPSGTLQVSLQGDFTWSRPGINLRSIEKPDRRFGFLAFPTSKKIELKSLEPGNYAISLAVDNSFTDADGSGSSAGSFSFEPPLATIQVLANETTSFAIDSTPYQPARLHGTVRLNGELASGGSLVIQTDMNRPEGSFDFRYSQYFGAYLVDSSGSFEADQFPAGDLRIRYFPGLSDVDEQLGVECLTSISSIPGQLQVQDLEFQIAGVEIQLVHPDGSPAPRQALHVQAPRFGTIPIVTDEQGYYRLDAVPVEGLRVQTIDRREIGTIKPEPGQRWTELELTLPE